MKTKFSQLMVAIALAFVSQAIMIASPATTAEIDCGAPRYALDQSPKRSGIELRYPKGQVSMLGEGWVRLGFTVTPTGDVQGIWLIDIVGAPIFAHAASGALAKSKYAPAVHGGRPVEFHGEFDAQFMIEGKNRAGTHAVVGSNYDKAKVYRDLGDHQRSVEILQESLKLTLNMYEYAITSYGLTVSYLGLKDYRRALLHVRHAAVGDAEFADRGQRKSALALLAELEARDGNFRASLCAFESLKKKYPDFQPAARLEELLATARRELTAATPVETQVELVESGREDLPAMWSHAVLRPALQFKAVQGRLKSFRLACPTAEIEGDFPVLHPVNVDRGVGECRLYVFGDPGAKFVLVEQ